MKTVYLIIIFSINACFAQSLWQWQNPLPQGNFLYKVQFTDDQTVYAAGGGGVIIKSTNGGSAWELLNTGITNELRGMYFPDAATGYASGSAGKVIKTTNSGLTWQEQVTPTFASSYTLNSIFVTPTGKGCAVGTGGRVLVTSNGGALWSSVSVSITTELRSVFFIDESTGWFAGLSGVIYKTTNSGQTWSAQVSGTSNALYSIWFSDANNGWVAGQNRTILKTTDGGATWVSQATGTEWLWDIRFSSPTNGIAVGGFAIFKTTDGGTTWNSKPTGLPASTFNLVTYSVSSSGKILAAGTAGMLLASSDAGESWNKILTGSTDNLTSVFFTDSLLGYTCGNFGLIGAGSIHKTTDGGASWTQLTTPSIQNPYDIYFSSDNTGFTVGRGLRILKTTDGGLSWIQKLSGGTTEEFKSIGFTGQNTGFAAGGYYNTAYYLRFYKTTDAGETWFSVSASAPDTNFMIYALKFVNTSIGFAAGTGGRIIKTTNGGENWFNLTSGLTDNFSSIFFVDTLRGYAGTNNGKIISTTDGGNSWVLQTSNLTNVIASIYFTNSNLGWAAGNSGLVRTTNGGTTWAREVIPSGVPISKLFFIGDSSGWLVGNTGMILRRPAANPVPVELVSFYSETNDAGVTLRWRTATELNNRGFFVERSTGGMGFASLSFIRGNGTTTVPSSYMFSDAVTPGRYFYRLRQVDFDGVESISNTVEAEVSSPGLFMVTDSYPNPFLSSTAIKYTLPEKGSVEITVYDFTGKEVYLHKTGVQEKGFYEFTLNLEKLSSGAYFCKVSAGSKVKILKLMHLK